MNILITGTSSGIGFGLATEFLKRGNIVFGISRRKPKELINRPDYKHLTADLTDHEAVTRKMTPWLKKEKKLDLVVLNSGILGKIGYMNEVSIKDMKAVMEINVWANKHLLDQLFGLNKKIKQVVGISSGAALRSSPGWGPYSLSKAALDMLMNIYAKEYPDTHFSAFAPGLVDSEIQDFVYKIKNIIKYPSAKKLQDARYTTDMPDALSAAPRLIEGFEKALGYESGSHMDVREM